MPRKSFDLRYVEVEYELWALRHMLDLIEPAIAHLSEVDEKQTLEELRKAGWDHLEPEVDIALQDIREKRLYVLPRYMRGPFLVAVWACLESAVTAIAEQKAREIDAPVRLGELKGDFLTRAGRYFGAVLGFPFEEDQARRRRLDALYSVRNVIAHANGLKEGVSDERWRGVRRALAGSGSLDNSRGMVILSHDYIEGAYEDVDGCLRGLVQRARATRPSGRKLRATTSADQPAVESTDSVADEP